MIASPVLENKKKTGATEAAEMPLYSLDILQFNFFKQDTLRPYNKSNMITDPEEVAKLFVLAWNDKDPELIALLFAEDAEFVNVTGLWWHNRESILKAHRYGFTKIFQNAMATLKRTRVKWLTTEIAVVHAKMELTGQTPIGDIENPGKRQNIFSFVMQKQSQGWLCVSAQNTEIIPGAETIVWDKAGKARGIDYRRN